MEIKVQLKQAGKRENIIQTAKLSLKQKPETIEELIRFTVSAQKVIEAARENDIETIRLDVLERNVPAERAYRKMGFKYLDTIQMFYEDTERTDFKVFEFIL